MFLWFSHVSFDFSQYNLFPILCKFRMSFLCRAAQQWEGKAQSEAELGTNVGNKKVADQLGKLPRKIIHVPHIEFEGEITYTLFLRCLLTLRRLKK